MHELARSDLPEGRVRQGLVWIAADQGRHPGQPLLAIVPGGVGRKAAYRFLHSGIESAEDILQPHW